MITSFRHKGLRRFFETGSKAGIQSGHEQRLRLILGRLDDAQEPDDMEAPAATQIPPPVATPNSSTLSRCKRT